jgi:thioredoxin-dependent peroxiredoxin
VSCKVSLFKAAQCASHVAGYQVFGLSADNPGPQSNWKKKEELPFPLLCDKSKTTLKMMGFMAGDKIKRSHIVLGKGAVVQMYSPGVKPLDSVTSATEFCIAKGKEGDEEEGAGETG